MSGGRGTWVRIAVLALLWGSGFLWIKLAVAGLGPVPLTLIRCLLGAATLLVLARAAGQRLPRGRALWGRLVIAAFFCNAVPFALFGIAEQTVDSGVAGVVNATTPLWSLLIGIALGTDRRLNPARIAGLALGFAGTLLIFAPWQRSGLLSWGALALLGAAMSYAVAFAYLGRKLTGTGEGPLALSAGQLIAASGLSALALPVASSPHATPLRIGAAVILGVFGTGVTLHLNNRLIADEGPTAAATVGYLLPVVSLSLGAIFLGEPLNARILGGMAVVLIGVGMTRPRRRTTADMSALAEVPATAHR